MLSATEQGRAEAEHLISLGRDGLMAILDEIDRQAAVILQTPDAKLLWGVFAALGGATPELAETSIRGASGWMPTDEMAEQMRDHALGLLRMRREHVVEVLSQIEGGHAIN